MSPSGKAPGFGPGIRGFESLHPSQDKMFILNALSWLFIFLDDLYKSSFVRHVFPIRFFNKYLRNMISNRKAIRLKLK